jgi:hypothetical protein
LTIFAFKGRIGMIMITDMFSGRARFLCSDRLLQYHCEVVTNVASSDIGGGGSVVACGGERGEKGIGKRC